MSLEPLEFGDKLRPSVVETMNKVNDLIDYTDTQLEKHMVAIGDSLGHEADQGARLWPVLLSERFGLTLHNYCQGGAGFVKKGNYSPSRDFNDELTAAYNDPTFDNENVELVVIYGGYNDVSSAQDATVFETNANTLFANAKTYFSNAKIIVFGINTNKTITTLSNYKDYYDAIKNAARTNGVQFTDALLWNAGQDDLYKSDNLHPTEKGSLYIANNMTAAINGMVMLTPLGAVPDRTDPWWKKGSQVGTLNCIYTPTASPNVYNLSFNFTIGTAGSYNYNFNIIVMSYLRMIPEGMVVPIYKKTTDNASNTTYVYYGCAFATSNMVQAKFENTIAAGDEFTTGQFVFNPIREVVTYQ